MHLRASQAWEAAMVSRKLPPSACDYAPCNVLPGWRLCSARNHSTTLKCLPMSGPRCLIANFNTAKATRFRVRQGAC